MPSYLVTRRPRIVKLIFRSEVETPWPWPVNISKHRTCVVKVTRVKQAFQKNRKIYPVVEIV